MRLWSLHPKYLDRQGLTALWREALLARAVLTGKTKGYRHHPQLDRFRAHASPRAAISTYLRAIQQEAVARGYSFDKSKVGPGRCEARIGVAQGQLDHEWQHLLKKLAKRNPAVHRRWKLVERPDCHPLMRRRAGGIEAWERT